MFEENQIWISVFSSCIILIYILLLIPFSFGHHNMFRKGPNSIHEETRILQTLKDSTCFLSLDQKICDNNWIKTKDLLFSVEHHNCSENSLDLRFSPFSVLQWMSQFAFKTSTSVVGHYLAKKLHPTCHNEWGIRFSDKTTTLETIGLLLPMILCPHLFKNQHLWWRWIA
jgi:hypothetical protein